MHDIFFSKHYEKSIKFGTFGSFLGNFSEIFERNINFVEFMSRNVHFGTKEILYAIPNPYIYHNNLLCLKFLKAQIVPIGHTNNNYFHMLLQLSTVKFFHFTIKIEWIYAT